MNDQSIMSSVPPPSTPPRQGPPPSILSSPVVRVPKYYDEYKRDEFQVFGYEADIHEPEEFKSPRAFLQFLRLQKFRFPKRSSDFTLSNFIDEANAMATALKKKCKPAFPLSVLFLPT